MIGAENFFEILKNNGINFFTGVPDSTLKNFTTDLEKKKNITHIISTNEGSAVSLGIGNYLATKRISCVYLQNSGLGNAINPLISISHKNVYSIPLLLIVGWRGSPGKKDEPQHQVQGSRTKEFLKLLNIKFIELNKPNDLSKISKLLIYSKKHKSPVAILVKRDVFKKVNFKKEKLNKRFFNRREILIKLLKNKKFSSSKIISTTGYISRELYQLRRVNLPFKKEGSDFYMVGGMGHASVVALGYSLGNNKKNVVCLDGDGSLLMHTGALKICGFSARSNFKHILINNNSHESVGGQKTDAFKINFNYLTKSLGYKNYFKINKKSNCEKIIKKFMSSRGPSFLEILVRKESHSNLIRPKNLVKLKNNFMKFK